LAAGIGVRRGTLVQFASNDSGGSPSLALRTAKAAGTTVECLLGEIFAADRCPVGGHVARRDAA
jgi:hypothetical protein